MANEGQKPRRGKLFYCLVASCLVLAILCACLVGAIVLYHLHACGSSDYPEHAKNAHPAQAVINTDTNPWALEYRLPSDTVPLHYDVLLHPDLENLTFTGEVTIRVHVKAPRNFLVVNTKDLHIQETEVTRADDTRVEIGEAFEYKPNEFWVVRTSNDQDLEPGIYSLAMKFQGSLSGKIVGFYRSVYVDSDTKQQRQIATSKFQTTYARQAYPCFDEPGFKSTFTVRLVRPRDGYIALSNMNEMREEEDTPQPGLTTVQFAESVPMVTYLTCFIVCDFQRLPPVSTSQGFPVSVYSSPGQVHKTKYALEVGVKIAEFYIEYFGIPYPLPKLDMIAIPDFPSGAMEHWGIITYREAYLLYQEGISSTTNKQRVAAVIGHELAHMWFGNLMTLKWWNDVWLNEGFGSFIEYKGVNHAHPDWQMLDQFLIEDLHMVLRLDAKVTSHPIVQNVNHPSEIPSLFDSISYSKGASVIRMLEDFMGEEEFRKGITNFLNRFKFANAVTQDMWDELQKVKEDINMTRTMDTWTRQQGYPVVTATRTTNTSVTLVQQRFLSDPRPNSTDLGCRWEIPITYINSESRTIQRVWLSSHQSSVTIQMPENATWYKINCNQKGFYRVNYEEDNWKQLSDLLVNDVTALDVSDRAHLLDDVFNLAQAGLVNYSIAMHMTRYLSQETDYVPWKTAASNLLNLDDLMTTSPAYPQLRKYIQCLVKDIYSKITLTVSEEDTHLHRLLRPTIVNLACHIGLEQCLEQVLQMFKIWISDTDNVQKPHPDIRSLVYGYGMKQAGSEREWDLMWEMYLNETDAQERLKLLVGLAYITEPWILQRYIQLCKNENYVRSQDMFSVFSFIASNPLGASLLWDFLREEWDFLADRYVHNKRYLDRIVTFTTRHFASQLRLEEMDAFIKTSGKGLDMIARANVEGNINWLAQHANTLEDWLHSQNDQC